MEHHHFSHGARDSIKNMKAQLGDCLRSFPKLLTYSKVQRYYLRRDHMRQTKTRVFMSLFQATYDCFDSIQNIKRKLSFVAVSI
jgi:hypothetical protein